MKPQIRLLSKPLRGIAFALVAAAGIFSIMATNGTPTPTANFKEFSVYPQERCPSTDVRAHWSTSPATDILIKYGDQVVRQGPTGDYVIAAASLNSLPNDVEIEFRIDRDGGEVKKVRIHTIRGIEYYSRTGLNVATTTYRYQVALPPETWDPKIYTYSLELTAPRDYTCTGSITQHFLTWQYDKGMATSGYLVKENGFKASFEPQVQAAGDWYFSLMNPDNDMTCPGWKLKNFNPTVFYGVGCVEP